MTLTISRLKTFCALRSCRLRVGHRDRGFITVDSGGVVNPRSFSSFPPTGEMSHSPDPAELIPVADQFLVIDNGETLTLTRDEFVHLVEQVMGPTPGAAA